MHNGVIREITTQYRLMYHVPAPQLSVPFAAKGVEHVREHTCDAVVNILVAAVSNPAKEALGLKIVKDSTPSARTSHSSKIMQLDPPIVAH